VAVLEAHELSEMTGMNEDDSEEALIVAEEQAEEQEKDAKQAKTREPGAGAVALPRMRAGAEAQGEPVVSEARQKFESLFGDRDQSAPPEEPPAEGGEGGVAFQETALDAGELGPNEIWPEESQPPEQYLGEEAQGDEPLPTEVSGGAETMQPSSQEHSPAPDGAPPAAP
jgi:hypothetical protein